MGGLSRFGAGFADPTHSFRMLCYGPTRKSVLLTVATATPVSRMVPWPVMVISVLPPPAFAIVTLAAKVAAVMPRPRTSIRS